VFSCHAPVPSGSPRRWTSRSPEFVSFSSAASQIRSVADVTTAHDGKDERSKRSSAAPSLSDQRGSNAASRPSDCMPKV